MAASMLFMVKRTPVLQQHSKQIFSLFASRPFLLPLSKSRGFSAHSSLLPPDVPRLAETARISLSDEEVKLIETVSAVLYVEEFAPKIQQVVNWFGQLQDVDLESIEPTLRADAEGDNVRQDTPETFEKIEALIAAVPSYEEPYIKVPKVVNKE